METHDKILLAIFDIVKTENAPETYLCTPHQLILRLAEDWTTIQKNLEILAANKLVTIRQLDKIAISITISGIEKAKALTETA